MNNTINQNDIPEAKGNKTINLRKVEIKDVILNDDSSSSIELEVVPFDRRNNEHVEFAFAYFDMLMRMPSIFSSVSDASKAYVNIFVKHSKEEKTNKESIFNAVLNDLRASRTVLNQSETQQEFNDFFDPA